MVWWPSAAALHGRGEGSKLPLSCCGQGAVVVSVVGRLRNSQPGTFRFRPPRCRSTWQ
jgi:hypothetical protein